MTVLLDTSVLIDVLNDLRGRRELLHKLVTDGHKLACCAITVAEVYAGMRPREARATEEFLSTLGYFETDRHTAQRAGLLKFTWARKGHTLGLPDVLVAAVALQHGLVLATGNERHFPMPELKLLPLPAVH